MTIAGVPLIYISSIITICVGGFAYMSGIFIIKLGRSKSISRHTIEHEETIEVESITENVEVVAAGNSSRFWGAIGILSGILTAIVGLIVNH